MSLIHSHLSIQIRIVRSIDAPYIRKSSDLSWIASKRSLVNQFSTFFGINPQLQLVSISIGCELWSKRSITAEVLSIGVGERHIGYVLQFKLYFRRYLAFFWIFICFLSGGKKSWGFAYFVYKTVTDKVKNEGVGYLLC